MRTVSSILPGQPARLPVFRAVRAFLPLLWMAVLALPLMAQESGEASLRLPTLSDPQTVFLGGITGHNLLMFGLVFC